MKFAPRFSNRRSVSDNAIDENKTSARRDPKPENEKRKKDDDQNHDDDEDEHAGVVDIEGPELECRRLCVWGIPTAETPGINTSATTVKPAAEKSSKANDKPFCNVERTK